MFDLGFSELLLIGFVALVVIGPERLPKVARAAGQWLGKLNRYVAQVKQDIDRDIKLEELRKMQQDMKDAAQKYEIMASETMREVETNVKEAEQAVREESGQISRVMQAMSATDGGLAAQEYEKIKAEEAAKVSGELPAPAQADSFPIEQQTVAPSAAGQLDPASRHVAMEAQASQPAKPSRPAGENSDSTAS